MAMYDYLQIKLYMYVYLLSSLNAMYTLHLIEHILAYTLGLTKRL